MKQIDKYEGKHVLVLGLAKSGAAAATLLRELGAKVVVNDYKPMEENPEAAHLQNLGIEVICGSHPPDLLERGFDFIVKNPGIPYTNPVVKAAIAQHVPIYTEIELAYQISEADIIGITGSNGKTTTTMLIYEMLHNGQKHPHLAGNIGVVSCEVCKYTKANEYVVMELSSFQLMGIEQFRPKISVLLNLFDAHLDYHGTKEAYGNAKANITKNQENSDYCVINLDDDMVVQLTKETRANKIYFSTEQKVDNGAYVIDDTIFYNDEKIIALQDIALPGKHNVENILAAVCAAKLVGVSNEAIRHILHTFHGVKHRLQFVKEYNERKFYNDSKATNILATKKAIQAFQEPIILLAGGLDRGNSFDSLIPSLQQVKAVVTFGQTSEKIKDAAQKAGMKIIKQVDNVEEAVRAAYRISEPGDVILLSPACASWDQFRTFEERGDIFIEAVHKL